ncbi:hypothetical protein MIN45_P1480 [Methylomarinovum tepidoasis]|uniref:Uncharacterized protein n=1 Tax=Methylomarinovum tepidoasis TaxID=2840183 RepID=A0AAU9CWP2_9GAMM|nr:hypothetical protein [Methylomarinovum sp. IN45]BCX89110.1 hypothetical protein MIN45_P1480 [Methylomarinovum sp. IN45]
MKKRILSFLILSLSGSVTAFEQNQPPAERDLVRQKMLEVRKRQEVVRARYRAEQVARKLKKEVDRKAAMRRGETLGK